MRTPSYTSRGGSQREPNMTPMIDVTFLLMIYFVWTAGGQIAERVLPSHVVAPAVAGGAAPIDEPPPEIDFDQVVVRLFWRQNTPAWEVAGTPLASLAEVAARLAAVARIKSDADVVIHPKGEVPLEHVISLYDVARKSGFAQVQFAASLPGSAAGDAQ